MEKLYNVIRFLTPRNQIHGYYASTSYVDTQIGKVIAELEDLGLDENTIIVLWGDYGFHLRELGIRTKHVNYELANNIPLLMVAPGVTTEVSSTSQLAESVDIFPTHYFWPIRMEPVFMILGIALQPLQS